MTVAANDYDAYARMLITFAMPQICQLLLEESGQTAESASGGLPSIVSQSQIEAAFLNPLNHFIKSNMSLGAEALKLRNEIAFQVLPDCQQVDAMIEQMAAQLKTSGARDNPQAFKDAQTKLKKYSEEVAQLFEEAKQLEKQSQELQEQSAKLVLEQHHTWKEYRRTYSKELCKALEEKGVPLNNFEKEAILRDDCVAEIIRQYENLSLSLAISKEKLHEKASYLFHLLAWFAIHASLARRLESHTPDDINQWLE
jgi:hypothetical protein